MKKLREGGSETQRPAQTVTSVEEPALNPLPRFVMGWTYPKTTSWRGASLVGRSPLCGLPAEQPWVGHGLRAAGQSGQALLRDVRLETQVSHALLLIKITHLRQQDMISLRKLLELKHGEKFTVMWVPQCSTCQAPTSQGN